MKETPGCCDKMCCPILAIKSTRCKEHLADCLSHPLTGQQSRKYISKMSEKSFIEQPDKMI